MQKIRVSVLLLLLFWGVVFISPAQAKDKTLPKEVESLLQDSSPASPKPGFGTAMSRMAMEQESGGLGLSLPLGGLQMGPGTLGTKDAFPPFFGDQNGQSSPAPTMPSHPDSESALLGTWGVHQNGINLDLTLLPQGRCTLSNNGNQINGTWSVQGNQIQMSFPNTQPVTLTFSIQGNMLLLSDGSRLERQNGPQNFVPQPQAMPQAQNATQLLEGAWGTQFSQGTLLMLFKNGMCGLNFNGKENYGPYTVQGNRLHVNFFNGNPLDVTFTVTSTTLSLSNGIVLQRQPMPGSPGQVSPQPTPGTWGQPPVGYPQATGGSSPLEGRWATRLQNGITIVFCFSGNQYMVQANGQTAETGTFTLDGNRLNYTVTSGPSAGQKGSNMYEVNGSTLIMTLPNGGRMQFMRQ